MNDNLEYFIDGTMHVLLIGHAYNRRSCPIVLGDIVASIGKLHKNTFIIDKSKHHLAIVFPEILHLTELEKSAIASYMVNSLSQTWKGVEAECVEYELPNNSGYSVYSLARKRVMSRMRELEKELLHEILNKKPQNPNMRIYIDGEFQEDNVPLYEDRVISICKLLSIDSLHDKLDIDASDTHLLEQINGLDDKHKCSRVYNWKQNDKTKHWWTWYMRLRNDKHKDKDRLMSDILQCTIENETEPSIDTIKTWNEHLEGFAYPTCYGMDRKRWRTHLYQIYLTELFCKKSSINPQVLENIVYGE